MPKAVKTLSKDGHLILWIHWIKAYEWDLSTNSMRVHHRLTDDHLHPDQSAKMRNKLAEEVLNEDMLYLMKVNTILGCSM